MFTMNNTHIHCQNWHEALLPQYKPLIMNMRLLLTRDAEANGQAATG